MTLMMMRTCVMAKMGVCVCVAIFMFVEIKTMTTFLKVVML